MELVLHSCCNTVSIETNADVATIILKSYKEQKTTIDRSQSDDNKNKQTQKQNKIKQKQKQKLKQNKTKTTLNLKHSL